MPDPRPNIIFIITDQQRYDTIAALGYPHVDTPHLDRLVAEGVSFTQCHVTAASCAPARASLAATTSIVPTTAASTGTRSGIHEGSGSPSPRSPATPSVPK